MRSPQPDEPWDPDESRDPDESWDPDESPVSDDRLDPGEPSASDRSVVLPEQDRYPVESLSGLHPTLLSGDQLLAECTLRTQRRSGPGGQHRNKTSSGVFLTHSPTGIVGEATERRSQADNRGIALQRLRFKLAVERRTASMLDRTPPGTEVQFRRDSRRSKMRLADSNPDKPALLALVLNDLVACGGQPRAIGPVWESSSTAIVRLLKSHPPAFKLLQAIRQHHGLRPLT